jgi:hypothetical protein
MYKGEAAMSPLIGSSIRRREFLVLGSVGAASFCIGELAAWAQPLAKAEGEAEAMSVGYLEGSAAFPSLRRLPIQIRRPRAMVAETERSPIAVVPADSLSLMGDTNLIGNPLRLTVHGLYPPGGIFPRKWAELPLAIDLDVLFPSPDPMFPDPIRFFAWSFRRQPGWNPSPPVSFVFPLDWQALPELEMRVVPAGGGPVQNFKARFTFDDEAGQPRLMRGAYVLGTSQNVWRRNVAALRTLGPDTPASFASVLFSMESEPAE